MKTTSHDLVAIARIALRCQFNESQLKDGGTEAERIISTMIRETAAFVRCTDSTEIELARPELRQHYGMK
jgi:hypothetical protein